MVTAVVSATGEVNLGNASEGAVSRWAIQLDESAGGDVSVTVKGRIMQSEADYVAIAYTDMADGATKTAALTADALILVDSSGLDVQLDVTVTSGTLTYYAWPLAG